MASRWTETELELLRDTSLTLREVSELTGRPPHGVENRANRLGVRRYREEWVPPLPATDRVRWSPEELAVLDDRSLPYAEVVRRTGRSHTAVVLMAKRRKASRRPLHPGRADLASNYRAGNWPVTRLGVLARDGYSCQDCEDYRPSGRGLVVHHLIPWKLRPVNDPDWLTTLCRSCHMRRPEHGWESIPPHIELQLAV